MASQLGQLPGQGGLAEARRDARAEPRGGLVFTLHGVAQDVARLVLHAPAVACGASLEAHLHVLLEVANDELGHGWPPLSGDIMISPPIHPHRVGARPEAPRRRTKRRHTGLIYSRSGP